jgi:hypothetical protein
MALLLGVNQSWFEKIPAALERGFSPAVAGLVATTVNAFSIKQLTVVFICGRTSPWVRLALGFIQKYLKTLLDNRSCSQYCSRRQQELSAFQSKSVTAGKYRSADVT